LLLALAVIFTVGLTWASLEVPRVVSDLMIRTLDVPDYDSTIHAEETEVFLRSFYIRWIGYGSLVLILALIVAGLVAEKRGLATVGAVAFFLPVFGHFAFSMFFLAGLGLLRFLWLPLLDLSENVMRLGNVVWLPYMAPVWLAGWLRIDIRDPLIYGLMGAGILVFLIGTMAWLEVRFRGGGTATSTIYRFSRHPQYVGWIVWSYGLALYVSLHSMHSRFKIRWSIESSLPWMIATLVIVGVALVEEIRMRRERGEEYETWARRTPFLLPLPRWVARAIGAPMRLVLRKEWPETGKEVAAVVVLYAALLILLSVPFLLWDWPPRAGLYGFPYNVWPFAGH
jgi:protein-S-isoprenylcysteine O-methyltransferase Ste14